MIVALFFIYIAAVLVFQAIRSREYERAVENLGLVLLDWREVPFSEVLPTIFQSRKTAFLSRVVDGDICGTHVYVFNHARDVGWWNKTTVVFKQSRDSDEAVRRSFKPDGDAALVVRGDWCMIQAQHGIKPARLRRWLETVVTIGNRS